MIRLTKKFTFETAHALFGYDGKCKNIHGHSYQLEVTVIGKIITDEQHPKRGMVMDFSDLKQIVNQQIVHPFDHALVLEKNSPYQALGKKLEEEQQRIIYTDYTPTCENMLYDFVNKLQPNLPQNVYLQKLSLHETQNSYCEWRREDQLK